MAHQRKEQQRKEDRIREVILKRAADTAVFDPTKTIDEQIRQKKQEWDRLLLEEGHKFDEDKDDEDDYEPLIGDPQGGPDGMNVRAGAAGMAELSDEQQREAAKQLERQAKVAQVRQILKDLRREIHKNDDDMSVPQERALYVEQNIELHLMTRTHKMNLKTLGRGAVDMLN